MKMWIYSPILIYTLCRKFTFLRTFYRHKNGSGEPKLTNIRYKGTPIIIHISLMICWVHSTNNNRIEVIKEKWQIPGIHSIHFQLFKGTDRHKCCVDNNNDEMNRGTNFQSFAYWWALMVDNNKDGCSTVSYKWIGRTDGWISGWDEV